MAKTIDDFQKTLATSKEQRLLAWSHIYLGRVLDLECKRDEALAEYKEALAVRDGQLDTRLAAERGVKAAYVQRGHEHDCDDEAATMLPARPPATQHREAPARCPAALERPSRKSAPRSQDSAPKPQ
jgi:tetratricopeptide (TPR) repeat protein